MSSDIHPINQLNAAGAPDFVTVEAQTLLDAAKAKFEADTGRTISPSQVEMYLLETIAYMLSVRGAEEQLAFENCFVAYARSEWLDRHGADRNTPRLQAAHSTTTLQFTTQAPSLGRIRIAGGTRVSDVSGLVQFLTLDVVYIEIGEASVTAKAQATQSGIVGNGYPAGSVSVIVDPVPGVGAAHNLTETGNGAEIENDTRYRERLALAFERIGDGLTRERYVSGVLAWNARCIDVAVTRPQPGYVNIYPLMEDGAPNVEELASLLAAFDRTNTHQGDFIQAFVPVAHDFDFPLVLTLSDPDAASLAQEAVQSVLNSWKRNLGGFIAPSELIRVAKAITGVIEADVPGLALVKVSENAWRDGAISSVTVAVL